MNKLKKRKTIMLKISVIIPVYNVADYLKECLDSVLQQTYENLEVILVNDGSTDISPSICDKYASEDSRILVVHKLNGGLSDARNCGLNISTGEYVFFIDSDDYLTDNNAITEIVEGIENHCDIDLVIFQYKKYYNVTNKMILPKPFDLSNINGKNKIEVLKYLMNSGSYEVSACCKIIKRELLIKNKIYFEKGFLAEDIDWSFHLMLHVKSIYAVNNPFYQYRIRKGSITNVGGLKNTQDLMYIIKKWSGLLATINITEDLRGLLLGYCAYQYAILMGHIYQYSYFDRMKLLKSMYPLKYLIRYDINYKTHQVLRLNRFFGFRITCMILHVYMILRKIGYRY